jgi:small-conductance mechanosensitive channel
VVRDLFKDIHLLVPAALTAATVGGMWVVGRLVSLVIAGRHAKRAKATPGEWDDLIVHAVSSRIPLWSVLAGAFLSLSYWPLTDRWVRLASTLLSTVWVASLTFAAASIASRLVVIYGNHALPGVTVSRLTQNVVRLVIVLFGLLAILNGFGIEIRPMLAALGVGGLAVALALQDPLSNLFAGILITMSGQVRIGDFVRLDTGLEGRVTDFNWRSTSLALGSGSTAVVPNAKLAQAIVTNFDLPSPEVNVPIDVVVGYNSDADAVENVAMRVAREVQTSVDGAVTAFEPIVRFSSFADLGLRATVTLRAQRVDDQAVIRHEFIRRLHSAFRQGGVVLPTSAQPQPK